MLPPLPIIMVTAPSSDHSTPMICAFDAVNAPDLLTLRYSPRVRASPVQWANPISESGWIESDTESEGGSHSDDDDDDDVALSHVKRTLQAARRPKIGLRGRIAGFFGMRR